MLRLVLAIGILAALLTGWVVEERRSRLAQLVRKDRNETILQEHLKEIDPSELVVFLP